MEYFDKRMVLDVIEDALTDMETPHGCGVAAGLCGAFYMCGQLSAEEWKAFLERIPAGSCKARSNDIPASETRGRSRFLN